MKEIGLINREQALTAIEPKQAVSGPVTCMNAEKMHDRTTDELICRQDAIRIVDGIDTWQAGWRGNAIESMKALPSVQPDIIRCKDCKFYSPMNRETKTGICNLTMHQNFGDDWFCAGAERREE